MPGSPLPLDPPTAREPAPDAATRALGHDPIIHALAQRAGTDAELKLVMEAVAQGTRNEAQLQYLQFQINQMIQQRVIKEENGAAGANPDAGAAGVGPSGPVFVGRERLTEFAATGMNLHALMQDVEDLKKETDALGQDINNDRERLEKELLDAEIIATNRQRIVNFLNEQIKKHEKHVRELENKMREREKRVWKRAARLDKIEEPLREMAESLRKMTDTAAILLGQRSRLMESFEGTDLEVSGRGKLLRVMGETAALLVGQITNTREVLSRNGIVEDVRKERSGIVEDVEESGSLSDCDFYD
ncbi:hypothetical protein W97_07973 [Coniosporium apollinis CBS 100218]|uniref:Uncharacterized protein n=1 Tax=Coniosporium apollinis (strain CBS 100218) TaxID=1168221 RepID=R7Z3E7_CONA1|nr:uncharacterized protein W97_07973 [Coniosporium apollinis CBS 100218]EON68715.1 hypothetical protein W97_07973 [Coniosporium apollinis CBS 100218]